MRNKETIPAADLALIKRMARRIMLKAGLTAYKDDIFFEGINGYIQAVRRLNDQPETSQAYKMIRARGAMLDFLRKNDVLDYDHRRLKKRIDEFERALLQTHGYRPSDEEVAQHFGCSVSNVVFSRYPPARVYPNEDGYDPLDYAHAPDLQEELDRKIELTAIIAEVLPYLNP